MVNSIFSKVLNVVTPIVDKVRTRLKVPASSLPPVLQKVKTELKKATNLFERLKDASKSGYNNSYQD
jgi:hypothetical protein